MGMTIILNPTQYMRLGQERSTEDGRFSLFYETDGQISIWSHLLAYDAKGRPEPRRTRLSYLDDTRGAAKLQAVLHMDPRGYLRLARDTGSKGSLWTFPKFPGGGPITGIRGSAAVLTDTGQLALWHPDHPKRDGIWTWSRPPKPNLINSAVLPGTLSIDVSDGGQMAPVFDKVVYNDTPETIGVFEGSNYTPVPSGLQVGLTTSGTVKAAGYVFFPTPGEPRSADVVVETYGPDDREIRASGTASFGFKLHKG
jgi:hypothetical protein